MPYMLHLGPVLLGYLAVFRQDNPGIYPHLCQLFRQGTSHISQTTCLNKWNSLGSYIQHLHKNPSF